MTRKQQMAIAYDLALSFTKDTMEATELAEGIIRYCEEMMAEEYDGAEDE